MNEYLMTRRDVEGSRIIVVAEKTLYEREHQRLGHTGLPFGCRDKWCQTVWRAWLGDVVRLQRSERRLRTWQ